MRLAVGNGRDLVVRKIYLALSVCVGFAIGHAASFAISDEPIPQNPDQDSPTQPESVTQPEQAWASPLTLKQKYLYSLDRVVGPTRLVGFVAHAGLDQVWKKPEQALEGGGSEEDMVVDFAIRVGQEVRFYLYRVTFTILM